MNEPTATATVASDASSIRMLRIDAVKKKTSLSRAAIYKAMQRNGFPRPARLGSRAVAWLESEVDGWLQTKLSARRAA